MTRRQNKISFEPLHLDHLTILHDWLQQPHVMEFWNDGHRTLDDVKRHYFIRSDVKSWIAHVNGHPFAYVQIYMVTPQHELAQWKSPTTSTLGMDLFIGDAAFIGKRLSSPIINSFIKECLPGYYPCRLLVDPDAKNSKAISAYKKAGFESLGQLLSDNKNLNIFKLDIAPV